MAITVVRIEIASTMSITGFRHKVRGSSFRTDSFSDFNIISDCQIFIVVLVDIFDPPLERLPHDHVQVFKNRTEHHEREELQGVYDDDSANDHQNKERAGYGQRC